MPDPAKKLERLWAKFKSRAFRESYVASHLVANIANQITTMREARGWTQTELALKSGLKQSQISALENPSQKMPSAKMLLKVAQALDIGLAMRFVRYSDVAAWATDPERAEVSVPSFKQDHPPQNILVQVPGIAATGKTNNSKVRFSDEPSDSIAAVEPHRLN